MISFCSSLFSSSMLFWFMDYILRCQFKMTENWGFLEKLIFPLPVLKNLSSKQFWKFLKNFWKFWRTCLQNSLTCNIQDYSIVSFVWDSDIFFCCLLEHKYRTLLQHLNGILVSIFVMSLICMWISAFDELCVFSQTVPNPWENHTGHQCDAETQ